MFDKNGREIKSGDVVRISNAYFKNDNHLYYVDHVPGDPNWCGSDICLKKISKAGKISTAKYNICFWPIKAYVSDPWKCAEANEWNKENAEIELVEGVNNKEIVALFKEEADGFNEMYKREVLYYGETKEAERLKRYAAGRYAAAERISAERSA